MVQIADRWFEKTKVDEDITHLTEPFVDPFIRCNIWHIRGRDRDVLIDTGMGIVSLKTAAAELFQKDLIAIATHAHVDHVGGLHEFDVKLAHPLEIEALESASDKISLDTDEMSQELIESLLRSGYDLPKGSLISALPYEGYDLKQYSLCPTKGAGVIEEGDVVDLGDRSFDVLHLPGHSPGSIALYERETETLFSGDAIYDGPLLGELPDSSKLDYIRTLRRLMNLPVRTVHGGHGKSFGREKLISIAEKYLRLWDA